MHFDGVSVESLAHRFGTPLVVLSLEAVRDNARTLRAAFGPLTTCLYSCKACYLSPVLNAAHEQGCGVEVCSGFEYSLARQTGVPAERIQWNAIGLTVDELETATDEPLAALVLSNCGDIRRVAARAQAKARTVSVMLRVHPEGTSDKYLQRGSRMGLDVEDGSALEGTRLVLESPSLVLSGFHAHTQILEVRPIAHVAALKSLLRFSHTIQQDLGHRITRVGIGGGLAERSFIEACSSSLSDFAAPILAALNDWPAPLELVVEPGRYLVCDAGIAVTRLIGTTRSAGTEWWVVDIGSNVLVPFDRAFRFAPESLETEHPLAAVSIGDRMSTYSGVMATDALLPTLQVGSLLVATSAGAYTLSTAQRFMLGAPAVVLLRDSEHIDLLRPQQSAQEWVREVNLGAGHLS